MQSMWEGYANYINEFRHWEINYKESFGGQSSDCRQRPPTSNYIKVQGGCGNTCHSCQICVTCEMVVSQGVANFKQKLFPGHMLQCYETGKERKWDLHSSTFFLLREKGLNSVLSKKNHNQPNKENLNNPPTNQTKPTKPQNTFLLPLEK